MTDKQKRIESGAAQSARDIAPAKCDNARSLAPSVAERLRELMKLGGHLLPIWLRAPANGPEHYTGLSRAKLYQLAGEQKIRSVSLREPGAVRGTRLFSLPSILEFIASHETDANARQEAA